MRSAIISLLLLLNANLVSAKPETVPYVDLNKYIGTWYEVASIPQFFQRKCVSDTRAEYSLDAENAGYIVVLNSCRTKGDDKIQADGRAKIIDTKTNSKLKVTFIKFFDWIFAFGGNYWILQLADDYSYAVVGDPTLKYAWILSRTPQFDLEKFVNIESNMKNIGYDTCAILTSVQSGGVQKRTPLCEFVRGN